MIKRINPVHPSRGPSTLTLRVLLSISLLGLGQLGIKLSLHRK